MMTGVLKDQEDCKKKSQVKSVVGLRDRVAIIRTRLIFSCGRGRLKCFMID